MLICILGMLWPMRLATVWAFIQAMETGYGCDRRGTIAMLMNYVSDCRDIPTPSNLLLDYLTMDEELKKKKKGADQGCA